MTNQPTNTTPLMKVEEAIAATGAFQKFLIEENENLNNRRLEEVEAGLKLKVRLAREMEKHLSHIKAEKENISGCDKATARLELLKSELASYQKEANKNAILLQAMHQTTADILMAIKDTVEKNSPKSGAYGNTGKVENTGSQQKSFVNKAV